MTSHRLLTHSCVDGPWVASTLPLLLISAAVDVGVQVSF